MRKLEEDANEGGSSGKNKDEEGSKEEVYDTVEDESGGARTDCANRRFESRLQAPE